MKSLRKLFVVCATMVVIITTPLTAQASGSDALGEAARDTLRDLTYEEENDRVLVQLLALLPAARDAAQLELAVERWTADLHPADAVSIRFRIEELLRETPDRDLYGLLVSLAVQRESAPGSERTSGGGPKGLTMVSSGSCPPGYADLLWHCCRWVAAPGLPSGGFPYCVRPAPAGTVYASPQPEGGPEPPHPDPVVQ